MVSKKNKWGTKRRPTEYDPLLSNFERLHQAATLLAPSSKSGAPVFSRVAVLKHILNWWPYREECGNIGVWIFTCHKDLARKCGITKRQSEDAVSDLRHMDRIETKTRKVGGIKKLHLRPSGGTLRLAKYLAQQWELYGKAFQPVWDEALDLDLAKSCVPSNLTLHHIIREWDAGSGTLPLLPKAKRALEAAKLRLSDKPTPKGDSPVCPQSLSGQQTAPEGDLLAYQTTPKGGKPLSTSPPNGKSIIESENKESESKLNETSKNLIPIKKGKESKPATNVGIGINQGGDSKHSILGNELPEGYVDWQSFYEVIHPEMSPTEHYALFQEEHPDKPICEFTDLFN